MKKILFLIITTFLCLSLYGCNKVAYLDGCFAVVYKDDIPYLINKDFETFSLAKYDYIIPEFSDYLVVSVGSGDNKKFGFIKNNGEEIIKPSYDYATNFFDDKAIVTLDDKTMIINPKNEILFTFPANMFSSSKYSEDMLVVEYEGKYTYLDNNYKKQDVRFDYAGSFVNGYAVVGNIIDGAMKYGLIDKSMNIIIDIQFDFLDNYYNGYLRCATAINAKNNEYAYSFINLDGNYLKNNGTVLTYDFALNFSNGYALVANYDSEELYGTYKVYNYINNKGETPFHFNFRRIGEGLYYFNDLVNSGDTNTLVSNFRIKASGAGSWYVLELYENTLEEISFIIPEKFAEKDNILYYKTPYDMTEFKFSSAYGDSSPLSRVRIYTGEYGLVDSTGTYILPAEYSFLFY